MDQIKTVGQQPEQMPERTAEAAAQTAAEAMATLSPASRTYFQGFLNGLQAAEEVKKAG